MSKVALMIGGLSELSKHIHDEGMTTEEVHLYVRAAEFIGAVCGRAALFAALSEEGVTSVEMVLANMESFLLVAGIHDKNVPIGLGENSLKNMETFARHVYTPVAVESFCKDLEKAKTDRVMALTCILDLTIAAWESGKEGAGEPMDFCEHCEANRIAALVLPEIENLLMPKVKARQFAASLESFSLFPQVPEKRGDSLRGLASQIREFADIDDPPEDIENWDEILDDVSHIYACAKVESTALVAKGLLPAENVARAFCVDVSDIEEFAGSHGIKQYLDCVWEDE